MCFALFEQAQDLEGAQVRDEGVDDLQRREVDSVRSTEARERGGLTSILAAQQRADELIAGLSCHGRSWMVLKVIVDREIVLEQSEVEVVQVDCAAPISRPWSRQVGQQVMNTTMRCKCYGIVRGRGSALVLLHQPPLLAFLSLFPVLHDSILVPGRGQHLDPGLSSPCRCRRLLRRFVSPRHASHHRLVHFPVRRVRALSSRHHHPTAIPGQRTPRRAPRSPCRTECGRRGIEGGAVRTRRPLGSVGLGVVGLGACGVVWIVVERFFPVGLLLFLAATTLVSSYERERRAGSEAHRMLC